MPSTPARATGGVSLNIVHEIETLAWADSIIVPGWCHGADEAVPPGLREALPLSGDAPPSVVPLWIPGRPAPVCLASPPPASPPCASSLLTLVLGRIS